MSEATNTRLMETSPGGENTQYESAATFTQPHAKSGGQFGDSEAREAEGEREEDRQKRERGEKTAENVRYGEAISEHGFGGETVGNGGSPGEGSQEGKVGRREQGYGGGSGIGG